MRTLWACSSVHQMGCGTILMSILHLRAEIRSTAGTLPLLLPCYSILLNWRNIY